MYQLRQKEEYTDVTLQSDDVEIKCHRNVLAVASDCFKAIFRSGVDESKSPTVQLTMAPDILSTIVQYIYTGEIELTADNVESLVKACDVLQLDSLKTACESFMLKQVEKNNFVSIYRFATSYRLVNLERKARRFILSEFRTVAFTDEFKALSCSQLIGVITDDDVNVEYEDVVFEAVLGWIRHDLANRKSSVEMILRHVRLPYCSPNYLRHVQGKADMLTAKCFVYLHEAMAFQADPVHQHEMSSCRTVPRSNFRVKSRLLVVGGLISVDSEDVSYNHCHYYEENTNCWESLTDLPDSRVLVYSVCRVDAGLLVTGGFRGSWLYDLGTKKWETMPPLIYARYKHRSVSLGNCVYVLGGLDNDHKMLAIGECLTLKRRQWSTMVDMPEPVYYPMATTYGNNIFVFGGRQVPTRCDVCCTQVFDTIEKQWSRLADTPEVCSLGAAVTLNNCIYVVGGHSHVCLKYEPASDSWTTLSRPKLEHGFAPAVAWRGSILLAGGGRVDEASSVIEQFDPVSDTWSVYHTALKERLWCHGLFNVDFYDV